MPRPGRPTTERAKDFKGTLLQLLKTMGAYKISLIVVIVFAILFQFFHCLFNIILIIQKDFKAASDPYLLCHVS